MIKQRGRSCSRTCCTAGVIYCVCFVSFLWFRVWRSSKVRGGRLGEGDPQHAAESARFCSRRKARICPDSNMLLRTRRCSAIQDPSSYRRSRQQRLNTSCTLQRFIELPLQSSFRAPQDRAGTGPKPLSCLRREPPVWGGRVPET